MDDAGRRFLECFKRSKRTLAIRDVVHGLAPASVVSGIFVCGIGGASWALGAPVNQGWWAAALFSGFLALALDVARHGWSDARAAHRLDAAPGAASRYSTGLSIAHKSGRTPLEDLALQECSETVAARKDLVPVRLTRNTTLSAGAALWMFGILFVGIALYLESSRPDATAAASSLDQIADQMTKEEPLFVAKADLEALEKGLREEAERLRRGESENPERDAIRAMSEAGLKIQRASDNAGAQGLKPSELDSLEQAASRQPAGEGLESALEAGDLNAASARAAEMPPNQARDAALEAFSRQQGQASPLMQQLAQPSGGGDDASKLLSDALKKSAEAQKQAEQLAKLQAALSDMKMDMRNAQQQQGQQQMSPEQQQQMLAAMQQGQDSQGQGQTEQVGVKSSQPTGKPGSEKDTGSTLDPYGRPDDQPPTELLSFIRGQRTDGAVESSNAETDNMDADVRAQWREVQFAAEQAAAESVKSETIPPGARRLVIRYFEELRPEE